mmetsp:Transcript_75033/g.202874  ORF Transcript_75033/g.202874 Transcript_75033/m.202874 type:complete len:236 (+) Transcript_75033:2110-2817(+)
MMVDFPFWCMRRSVDTAAASLSSLRQYRNHSSSDSLSVVSTSSRTKTGFLTPAREKETSCDGSVAEKSRHCLETGVPSRIFCSCSAKPSSKRRSASSKTRNWTRDSDSSASKMWCIKRPGVAMTTSGLFAKCSNCASMACPPTKRQHRKPVNRPSCLQNLAVCIASSRVGDRTTARKPTDTECELRVCMMGMRNAAVLPDPVRAIATTSWPSRMVGMVFLWMGVGNLYPIFMMAL